MVGLGDSGDLGARALGMRDEFQRRTGLFSAEDPWFETRARAFWDDALTTQGFALLASRILGKDSRPVAEAIVHAHRGLFVVEETHEQGGRLLDLWSGAELIVSYLDSAQALSFEHGDGAIDARVTRAPSGPQLFVLPGAYHHAADALEPAMDVLAVAKERGLGTQAALDSLLRMDLVLRSSSRVKAAFAYRAESLRGA
jgi:hypothetical protein